MVTINNSNKPSNWMVFLIVVLLGLLIFALMRGCKNAKKYQEDKNELKNSNDSLKALNKQVKIEWGASEHQYQDSLAFERGQRLLVEAQKERTENELNRVSKENAILLDKYKYHKYVDTGMVLAPGEFVDDCKDCFTQLEKTDRLSLNYQAQVKDWGKKFERETSLLKNRINQVESERNSYHKKVNDLAIEQEKLIDRTKPRGRLYLSWGVLWSPWPVAAGGGLMYQTPRNVMFGLKGYYGVSGGRKNTTVETTINFPLSLKIK